MIGSPAQFNKNETEEEVRVTEESTFAFATNVGREAKEMIKGLSVLKEQDTNSPQYVMMLDESYALINHVLTLLCLCDYVQETPQT